MHRVLVGAVEGRGLIAANVASRVEVRAVAEIESVRSGLVAEAHSEDVLIRIGNRRRESADRVGALSNTADVISVVVMVAPYAVMNSGVRAPITSAFGWIDHESYVAFPFST